jgi:hypothetical protein
MQGEMHRNIRLQEIRNFEVAYEELHDASNLQRKKTWGSSYTKSHEADNDAWVPVVKTTCAFTAFSSSFFRDISRTCHRHAIASP